MTLKLLLIALLAMIAISTISGVISFFIDLIRFGKKQMEESVTPSTEAYAERLEEIEKEEEEDGTSDGSNYSALSDIRL